MRRTGDMEWGGGFSNCCAVPMIKDTMLRPFYAAVTCTRQEFFFGI